MKDHFLIFCCLLSLGIFSQSGADSTKGIVSQVRVYEEIKVPRETLMKAKIVKDIIPGMPEDCRVDSCAFLCSGRKGEFYNGEFKGSDNFQDQMDTKNTMKIYIQIISSCPDSHKPRYAIKIE